MDAPFASDAFVRAVNARSETYFSTRPDVAVDGRVLAGLLDLSRSLGGRNVRLCLHPSPEALFHEMVILEYASHYCRPHRHPSKSESCHLLSGRLAVIVFDEAGGALRREFLSAEETRLFRVGENRWHSVVPLSEYVVYHEAKPGPFARDTDNLYAAWAPDGSDPAACAAYVAGLFALPGGRP